MAEFKKKTCHDIEQVSISKPDKYFCEDCQKSGDSWVHLRKCQECGITLCCDSSPNKHATKHFMETGHPVVLSAEPGETWVWCYEHEIIQNNMY